MDCLMRVGSDIAAVKASHQGIMEILNAKADQATIQRALECFEKSCTVQTINVNGCSLISNTSDEKSNKKTIKKSE